MSSALMLTTGAYLHHRLSNPNDVTQSTAQTLTCGPPRGSESEGIGGDSFGMSFERQSELEQSRHKLVVPFVSQHCLAVASSYGSRF